MFRNPSSVENVQSRKAKRVRQMNSLPADANTDGRTISSKRLDILLIFYYKYIFYLCVFRKCSRVVKDAQAQIHQKKGQSELPISEGATNVPGVQR